MTGHDQADTEQVDAACWHPIGQGHQDAPSVAGVGLAPHEPAGDEPVDATTQPGYDDPAERRGRPGARVRNSTPRPKANAG